MTHHQQHHRHGHEEGGGGAEDGRDDEGNQAVMPAKHKKKQHPLILSMFQAVDISKASTTTATSRPVEEIDRSSTADETNNTSSSENPAVLKEATLSQQEEEIALPSNLTYKDQGRDIEQVVVFRQRHASDGSHMIAYEEAKEQEEEDEEGDDGAPLPSNLTYKDQGRNVEDVLGGGRRHGHRGERIPTVHAEPVVVAPNEPVVAAAVIPVVSSHRQRRNEGNNSKLWRRKCMLVTLVFLVGIAVAIGLATSLDDDDDGDDVDPDFPSSLPPTSAPPAGGSRSIDETVQWLPRGEDLKGDRQGDRFGNNVALSADANVLAVAASGREVDTNDNSTTTTKAPTPSYIRTFLWNAFTEKWTQVGSDIQGNVTQDTRTMWFSMDLSEDGMILAAGETYLNTTDNGGGNVEEAPEGNVSYVQVFRFDTVLGDWVPRGSGIPFLSLRYPWVRLSRDGKVLSVSESGRSEGLLGFVQVHRFDESLQDWAPQGLELVGKSSNDGFGNTHSLSADGSVLSAGAPGFRLGDGLGTGQVRVFRFDGAEWTLLGQELDAREGDAFLGYDTSLSATGKILACGAPYSVGNTGRVLVFRFNETQREWKQMGKSIVGQNFGEFFGYQVALSDDGLSMVVSSYTQGVRIFKYYDNEEAWIQSGEDLKVPDDASTFGRLVSMSGDGKVIALSHSDDDENGEDAGRVHVLELHE